MILDTFDIIEYLDEHSIPYHSSGKNISRGWVGVQCPWCGDESNHLGINMDSKTINCWRCGEKGSIIQYIQEIDQCPKQQAWRIIEKFQDYSLDHVEKEQDEERPEYCQQPKGISKNFTGEFRNWIISRRFNPDILIKKYNLLMGKEVGFFKYRLVVPVYLNRKVVTYVGRDVTGKQKVSYKNWPRQKSYLDVKETLYNIDSVKKTALVVEGITDVWRIGEGAVATFGTKYTKAQINLLSKKCKEVFIMFDADATTQAFKFANDLSSIINKVKVVELSSGDPDNLTEKEVSDLRYDIFGRR